MRRGFASLAAQRDLPVSFVETCVSTPHGQAAQVRLPDILVVWGRSASERESVSRRSETKHDPTPRHRGGVSPDHERSSDRGKSSRTTVRARRFVEYVIVASQSSRQKKKKKKKIKKKKINTTKIERS